MKIDIVLEKASQKKPKKSKKPKPTNPELWARAQAEAKKRYDVHPSAYCVPVENSQALTRSGWLNYEELELGTEILAYDILTDTLKYTPVIKKHFFENENLIRFYSKNLRYSYEATPNHKVLFIHDSLKEPFGDLSNSRKIFETIESLKNGNITLAKAKESIPEIQKYYEKYKELNFFEFCQKFKKEIVKLTSISDIDIPDRKGKILVAAPLDKQYPDSNLENYVKDKDPIKMVLSMSFVQLMAFLYWSVMRDDCQEKRGENEKNSYVFKPYNLDNFEAVQLAAFLTGHIVSANRKDSKDFKIITQRTLSNSKLFVENLDVKKDVWCPETVYHTWVMRQNDTITITGNSNSFAAKWYKDRGGKWKIPESLELFEYSGGLRKWHKEKWVDISRKNKDGSHPECGSSDDKRKGYPKCVPKSKALSMNEKEKKNSSTRKQRAERENKRVDKKPIYVKT